MKAKSIKSRQITQAEWDLIRNGQGQSIVDEFLGRSKSKSK